MVDFLTSRLAGTLALKKPSELEQRPTGHAPEEDPFGDARTDSVDDSVLVIANANTLKRIPPSQTEAPFSDVKTAVEGPSETSPGAAPPPEFTVSDPFGGDSIRTFIPGPDPVRSSTLPPTSEPGHQAVAVQPNNEPEPEPVLVRGTLIEDPPPPARDTSGADFLAELRAAAGAPRRKPADDAEAEPTGAVAQPAPVVRAVVRNAPSPTQLLIGHAAAPRAAMDVRDALGFLRRKDIGFDFVVGDAATDYPAATVGAVLGFDHLTLFPGLGTPPRHRGHAHTGRLGALLSGYARGRASGVLSLYSDLGNYSAWYLVDGALHYVCMAPNQDHLLDVLQIHGLVPEATLNQALLRALPGGRGLFALLVEHGVLPRAQLDMVASELLRNRLDRLMHWGSCRFEFRPGLVLPYELPVTMTPLHALHGDVAPGP